MTESHSGSGLRLVPTLRARNLPIVPVLLFVFAAALRVVYVLNASHKDLMAIPLVDEATYDELARRLLRDRQLTFEYFWQPFLYPILLSIKYALLDGSMMGARIVQAIVGGLTCVLTYRLGQVLLRESVARIAAVIVAINGPLIIHDCELVASSYASFLSVALVLMLISATKQDRPATAAAFGAVAGAAILLRPEFVLFAVFGVVWLFLKAPRRSPGWRSVRSPVLAAMGCILCTTPVAFLNKHVGNGQFTVFPFSGELNLYIGNNANPCSTLTARPGWAWTKLISMPMRMGFETRSAQSRFFGQQVREFVKEEPAEFLRGILAKGLRAISGRELPRNTDIYVQARGSPITSAAVWKLGPFGFPSGLIIPLALIGIWRSRRRIPAPLLLFPILFAVAIVLVFVTSRHRIPMMPSLCVLAALGIMEILDRVRAREWRTVVITGVVLALATGGSALPGPFCEEELTYAAEREYLVGLAFHHGPRFDRNGVPLKPDLKKAEEHYSLALRRDSGLADAWNELASIRFAQGRYGEARELYLRTTALAGDHGIALHNLGVIALIAGNYPEGVEYLREAIAGDPMNARSHYLLGEGLLRSGKPQEAIDPLRRSIRLQKDPEALAEAICSLGNALAASGMDSDAILEYSRALDLDPACNRARIGLAWMLATTPDDGLRNGGRALRLAEECVATDTSNPLAFDALAASLAAVGRYEEAVAVGGSAARIAEENRDSALVVAVMRRIELYRAGKPYRDVP